MKTFIKAITITIIMVLFTAGSVSPVIAQESQTNQLGESVAVATSHSLENEALNRLRMTLGATMQHHGSAKVLVIPTAQIQPQEMATLMEDMTVMCRIFDKKMAQSNLKRAMPFYGMALPGRISIGGDSHEAMYIQGYGALFMMTVDFPLSAPPETEEKEQTEEQETDPVWKQMRQEIFSPQQAVKQSTDRPEEKYDPEKVENLKATLIKALVHAANIRGLNPDESVILSITGKSGSSSNIVVMGNSASNGFVVLDKKSNTTSLFQGGLPDDVVRSSQMVLVIRAKKSDIDAFAKDQIDINEFKQKVRVISYPSLGGSFSQDSPSIFFGSGYGISSSSSPAVPEAGTGVGSSNSRRGRSSSGSR